jgi:hypothetical protein
MVYIEEHYPKAIERERERIEEQLVAYFCRSYSPVLWYYEKSFI